MTTVVLLGTLDTKGEECAWLRTRLRTLDVDVLLVDTGVSGLPRTTADIPRDRVALAAGDDLDRLRAEGDRGAAVTVMGTGAAAVVNRLYAQGRLHGVLAVGGSSGASIAGRAVRDLPVGVPKLIVSSMAGGDVSPYVGAADVAMLHSVVDIAGVNRVSAPVFANAAAGIAGMAKDFAARGHPLDDTTVRQGRPLIAASMAGVTTPGVDAARERLDELGYEVLVFHTSGSGGRALESLAARGLFAGVLDLTPCELADDLVGGVLTAGPDRLEAAGRAGIPQVVSPGALDMVKFGPLATLPDRFRDRHVRVHNPSVTVIRTTADEVAELGRRIGGKLRSACGPAALCLPLHGLSTLSAPAAGGTVPAGPYHEPETDAVLFDALRRALRGSAVAVHELPTHINDPGFGRAAADHLHRLIVDHCGATAEGREAP
ncbi:hypothetical protein DSC45_10985 [Streptomyces sp. YIM 130001]|uniref:Tm-1-like ATP-binding domain-containing protein n=1 Tax=Streptomyces sp. YIM 130001 TaxID=2259644 RepID=UPI000E65B008|nr:Tm-1-like ATP-binding domain-containing protein [Streptomyces sp. YIM 130001]RII18432.1 hypothetical protein DSC45_10985 [Streptomyces sp. YIM 130001]